MICHWLSAQQIDAEWESLRPYLERFERELQLVSADVIRHDCRSGNKQLWSVYDTKLRGVVVTHVVESPKGRICEIYAACGSCTREGIRAVLGRLRMWAVGVGCVFMRIYGRKGWKRVLPEFQFVGIILEQRL